MLVAYYNWQLSLLDGAQMADDNVQFCTRSIDASKRVLVKDVLFQSQSDFSASEENQFSRANP